MSLQRRLFLAVAAAMLASAALGGGLAGWRARHSVRAELTAALEAGVQTVHAGLEDIALAADPRADARRFVATFGANRHIHVRLLDDMAPRPRTSPSAAPAWFVHVIAPSIPPVDVISNVGTDRLAVRLEADARNEVGEVWEQFCDAAVALGVFCVLVAGFVAGAVRRAVRPIDQLVAGLSRLGAGDYSSRIADSGASDLRPLVQGFNRAAALLDEARGRNARLSEQVLALQEEERAELARQLHDDIGPALFAVSLTAATIGRLAAKDRADSVADHAGAIVSSMAQMQKSVRSLLGRLRPLRATEAGLRPAVEDLVRFWQEHNPQIEFELRITADETGLDEKRRETIFLLVQEALVNAIRHGRPERIGIAVAEQPGAVAVTIEDDGRGGLSHDAPGIGLELMRERVAALAGTLRIGPRDPDRGWQVDALLPA